MKQETTLNRVKEAVEKTKKLKQQMLPIDFEPSFYEDNLSEDKSCSEDSCDDSSYSI